MSQGTLLRIVRHIAASPTDVYRAWTEPTRFAAWWGPPGCVVPRADLDVRPGGRYAVTMQMTGRNTFELSGTYVAVEPPRRLVYTWAWRGAGANDGVESLVTVTFNDAGHGQTEVVVEHERLPGEASIAAHQHGWGASLDKLVGYFAA